MNLGLWQTCLSPEGCHDSLHSDSLMSFFPAVIVGGHGNGCVAQAKLSGQHHLHRNIQVRSKLFLNIKKKITVEKHCKINNCTTLAVEKEWHNKNGEVLKTMKLRHYSVKVMKFHFNS